MKLAHNIKISVFVKPEDDENAVKKHLLSLFPFDLAEEKIDLKKSSATGFGQRQIIIFEAELGKDRHINAFLKSLNEKFNEQQKSVLLGQDNRLDDECNFFFRLDKQKLLSNEYWITDRGDCYHIRISVAAFPKKKERAREVVKKIFG